MTNLSIELTQTLLAIPKYIVVIAGLVVIYLIFYFMEKKIKKLKSLVETKESFTKAMESEYKDRLKIQEKTIAALQGVVDIHKESAYEKQIIDELLASLKFHESLAEDQENELIDLAFENETLKAKLHHKKLPVKPQKIEENGRTNDNNMPNANWVNLYLLQGFPCLSSQEEEI